MDAVSKRKEEKRTEVAIQVYSRQRSKTGDDDDEKRDSSMIISARGRWVQGSETCFRRVPFRNPILEGRFYQQTDDDRNILLDIDSDTFSACIAYAKSALTHHYFLLTELSTTSTVQELLSTADYLGITLPTIATLEELLGRPRSHLAPREECVP